MQSNNKKPCGSCAAAAATPATAAPAGITPSSTVAGSVPLQTSNTQQPGTYQSPKGGSRKSRKSRKHRKHKKSRRVR